MSTAMSPPDALDPDKIRKNLKTKRIGGKILVYNRTTSTNDIAAEYAKNKNNDGLVILTEEQTKGRGRSSNKWQSGCADSILCSILLTESTLKAELLSLTAAVATAEAIGKPAKHRAKIKWPNDIILNNKKVAGILLESKKFKNHTAHIIGIGINCHQTKNSFPRELRAIATSLRLETGSDADRISLVRRLLTSIDHWLRIAEKNNRKLIDQWRKLSIQLNHRLTVAYNRRKFTGNCIGLDPQKGLIVQLDSGGTRFFDAAHSSIVN